MEIDRRANLKAWVLMSVFFSGMVCTAAAGRIIDDGGPADLNSIQAAVNTSVGLESFPNGG